MTEARSPKDLHPLVQEAFNRQDLDAMVALYEPDALFVSRSGTVEGREAIRAVYRAVFATGPRIELQTVAIHCSGHLAMLQGRWAVIDGDARRQGRNTEVARLQPSGRWLFVIDQPYSCTDE